MRPTGRLAIMALIASPTAATGHDIVVIGGSTGSIEPLKAILRGLKRDTPASIFVCTHMPAESKGYLAGILQKHCEMPVKLAEDGEKIQTSTVYLPRADRHLLIRPDSIQLGIGPRENMVRPSVDPLFRSATLHFGPRVIGIVLSGMLADGAAGLAAVAAGGGITVIQEPVDAQAPDMPLNALAATKIDHVLTAAEIAERLAGLIAQAPGSPTVIARDIELEVGIAAGTIEPAMMANLAVPSPITCPQCHGVLSEVRRSPPLRYRCQIGHAFTAQTLKVAQDKAVSEAMRVAFRMLEERIQLVTRMAQDAQKRGQASLATLYSTRREEYQGYAHALRQAILTTVADHSPAMDERSEPVAETG